MKFYHRNVPLLSVAQALMMSSNSLIVATAALVGYNLAEDKSLATLPLAIQFIAVMCTSIPAAMLMEKIGRKAAFLIACGFGVGWWLVLSQYCDSQWQFLVVRLWHRPRLACLMVLVTITALRRRTVSSWLTKARPFPTPCSVGLVAAVAGPSLARMSSREWIAHAEFAGSYMAIICSLSGAASPCSAFSHH